ncbi:MAG: undecaprenyl/decaprenyl-phosphate alpha-N-acetylglucosaminyl 1-phosphate transferase [Thermoleophilia bacterium]|nr:undecaprenyl/decaprenyl-phosphate alpha-N-acetylglucosaminyl 1-phosphate transferase [Thermoleophilia bacterium]
MTTTLIPILAAIAAAVVVLILTPLSIRFAVRVGAVDQPAARRIHERPIPRLGGIAIVLGFLLPALWFLPVDSAARGLIAGGVLVAVLGVVDDILGLQPGVKFLGQIACAAVPVVAGLTIDHLTLPLMGAFDLGVAQYAVTIVWFVAIVNIINFTDGMDGLAAGVVGIGATTFAIIAASLGRADSAILAAALAGACVAFLRVNFNPARTFMGDGGSMFLGFMLAGIAISGVMKSAAAVAIVLPLVVLAIPILDTAFVILKRIKHGTPVYSADTSHFHHRFLAIGWSQRRTVLSIYAWCGLMAFLALAMRFVPYTDGHGNWDAGWTVVLAAVGAVGIAGAVYLVYVLEILKWKREPVVQIVRRRRAPSGDEVPPTTR